MCKAQYKIGKTLVQCAKIHQNNSKFNQIFTLKKLFFPKKIISQEKMANFIAFAYNNLIQ